MKVALRFLHVLLRYLQSYPNSFYWFDYTHLRHLPLVASLFIVFIVSSFAIPLLRFVLRTISALEALL
jgi:hypothetical protein